MHIVRKLATVNAFHIVGLVFTLALFWSIHHLPLLGTLGFESANLLVVLLGPWLCLTSTLQTKSKFIGYQELLGRELVWLFVHLLVMIVPLFINGFFVTSCSQGAGFWPFVIIAVPPLLLLVALGSTLAALLRSALLKSLICIVALCAYFAWLGIWWWHEGSFRVLSHASLLISSDLMTGDILSGSVLGFRCATLVLAIVVIWLGTQYLSARNPLYSHKKKRPLFSVTIALLLLFAHLLIQGKSLEALGKNKKMLRREYQILAEHDGLKIYANPAKTSSKKAENILEEARYYRHHLQQRLGEQSNAPVIIWLHETHEDKFLYTGAKNVHFALPKHREIHISESITPHPVLGHELAHIYAGEHSSTIFGLPGVARIIPNLALTEGIAMMLSEALNVSQGYSLLEQARALYQVGINVDVKNLFSENPLYFAKAPPRAAYIYAGAALSYFNEILPSSHRAQIWRQVLYEGTLHGLFASQIDLNAAINNFISELQKTSPPAALMWARQTMMPTSILSSDCSKTSRLAFLNRAIINLDTAAILTFATNEPEQERQKILAHAQNRFMELDHADLALVINEEERSHASETHEHIALALNRVRALINQKDFANALKATNAINPEYLQQNERRLMLIYQVLLNDYLNNHEAFEVSQAALAYLGQTKNSLSHLAQLSLHLGAAHMKADNFSHPILMSTYLLARASFWREGDHAQTIAMLKPLFLASLPPIIEKEVTLMHANALAGINEIDAALSVYRSLQADTAGEAIAFHDEIDRLEFKRRLPPAN